MLQYRYRPDGPATRRTLKGPDQPWSDYSPIIAWPVSSSTVSRISV